MYKLAQKIKRYFSMLIDAANKISSITGKSKLNILFDMIWCTILYGASPNNYYDFKFYNLGHNKRKTYVTHRISEQIIKKYNKDSYRDLFEDKTMFAEKFQCFFGREWLSLNDLDFKTFKNFAHGKTKIIYKPIDSAQGKGIEVLHTNNFKDYRALYTYLKENHGENGIIEEWIQQHEDISRIYDRAVNPIRVITITQSERCNFLVAGLTIGNSNEISNASCNDLVAPIDIDKGIITLPAANFEKQYKTHPKTGMRIEGFKIPYWKELRHLIQEASKVIPEIGYIGWDVAITTEGPILIEGNTSPGYKFYQIPFHLTDNIGNKGVYQRRA